METEKRRGGSFLVSCVLLEDVLHLPEGVSIIGAEWDFAAKCPLIHVAGPGLPEVPPGAALRRVIPLISCEEDDGGGVRTYSCFFEEVR